MVNYIVRCEIVHDNNVTAGLCKLHSSQNQIIMMQYCKMLPKMGNQSNGITLQYCKLKCKTEYDMVCTSQKQFSM